MRYASEVHILSKDHLAIEAQNAFWSPDATIKLTKKVNVVTFDSIVYDRDTKILFVSIDDRRFNFEESSSDLQSKFLNKLQATCPSLSCIKMVDLYPAIDGMYKQNSEGLIHRLAFECITGAVRDEKLKVNQQDLRHEQYHISGKAAIGGDISPFKLGVTWHPEKYTNLRTETAINISGTRGNLHKKGGIYSAEIESSGMFNEFCFALTRLVLYV